MATQKTQKPDRELCRMITCEGRVSYPHVFKPHAAKQGDKLKYSITLLLKKKTDLTGLTVDGKPRKLQDIIRNAKIAAFGEDEKQWPEELESPINDGDDRKYADKEGYAGHWVLTARSNEDMRPSVVGPDMTPLTEASEFYPGCYARVYICAYTWEYMKKQGVSFSFDHVQKLRDGKPFGGKKPVEQVFQPVTEEAPSEDQEENFA